MRRMTWTGTHLGDYTTRSGTVIAASGRSFSTPMIEIYELRGRHFSAAWLAYDTLAHVLQRSAPSWPRGVGEPRSGTACDVMLAIATRVSSWTYRPRERHSAGVGVRSHLRSAACILGHPPKVVAR